jgi:ABC-type multidrug transport system fused ATPase/permease subunit
MDLKEYDKLRKKISVKDFEGNNKALDKWLYGFSYVGNIGSIFFAYFLVYPALLKAITINLVSGFWGQAIAITFSVVFLAIFEIIKRYLIKNFSSDFVANQGKIKAAILGWFMVSLAIVLVSFYLSMIGAKNLATTSKIRDNIAQTSVDTQKDSLTVQFERKKKIYEVDNQALRDVNNDLRKNLALTPVGFSTIRRDYQSSIDKNANIISENQNEINKIDDKLKTRVDELKTTLVETKTNNASEDSNNIVLLLVIAIFVELMIIGGVYFREYFEFKLYCLNQQKFDKIYLKKDRYIALLMFIYKEGKTAVGDKVMSGLELKEIVATKSVIPNSNKVVEEFLHDMDRVGVFNTVGKRRMINATYQEAMDAVDKLDDTLRILENMK